MTDPAAPPIGYYFFEYIHPRTGKPRRTRYRMTLDDAKQRHGDAYKPLMDTVEFRGGGPAYSGPEPKHNLLPFQRPDSTDR